MDCKKGKFKYRGYQIPLQQRFGAELRLRPCYRRLQKGAGDIEMTAGTYTVLLDLKDADKPTWKLVRSGHD